ncbi:hypothetical protein [Streptomyces sp. NPDC058657]|uniref:hypothetical protein n=1 Tax=unclassified Streptomyces TaxID=2593676 RepID=UPI003653B849
MGAPERQLAGRRGKRLTGDERLRHELELCDRWGIPHSQFLGLGEGRWTARDRAKALAYADYQRTVCTQCGTRHEDWDHGGTDDGDDQYVAVAHRCVGCEVIADKQVELEKSGAGLHGLKVALIPSAVHAATEVLNSLKRTPSRHGQQDSEDDD